jgi:hypothetical protein
VDLVISPDPAPEEREAIAVALERVLAWDEAPAAYQSAWRRAGIAENLGGLGDGATAEQTGRDPRVVEPGDPR